MVLVVVECVFLEQGCPSGFGICFVPVDFIARQIDSVISDIGVDAVKTGMLVDAKVIEVVSHKLRTHAQIAINDVRHAGLGHGHRARGKGEQGNQLA